MLKEEENKTPPYEKILDGLVNEKLVIAKQFSKNMKIIEKQAGAELCLNSTKLCYSEREELFKLNLTFFG